MNARPDCYIGINAAARKHTAHQRATSIIAVAAERAEVWCTAKEHTGRAHKGEQQHAPPAALVTPRAGSRRVHGPHRILYASEGATTTSKFAGSWFFVKLVEKMENQ